MTRPHPRLLPPRDPLHLLHATRAQYPHPELTTAHIDRLAALTPPIPLTIELAQAQPTAAWLAHGLVTLTGRHLTLTDKGRTTLALHRPPTPPLYAASHSTKYAHHDLTPPTGPPRVHIAASLGTRHWGLAAVSSTGRWAMGRIRIGTLPVHHARTHAHLAALALGASLHPLAEAHLLIPDPPALRRLAAHDPPLGITHPTLPTRLAHLLGIDTARLHRALRHHRTPLRAPTPHEHATLGSAAQSIARWRSVPTGTHGLHPDTGEPLEDAARRIVTGIALEAHP